MQKAIKGLIKNPVFSNLLMVIFLVVGTLAALKMPREVFPEFSLDLIVISVPYIGASPDEVEEGICIKLENELEGIEGINKVTSTAVEGSGSVLVEVNAEADTYKVKDDIKSAVDRITTFPKDAEEPHVKEIINKRIASSIALYGDAPEGTLKEIAKEVKDELVAFPEISQVTISGVRDYEISIEVPEKNLKKYALRFEDIVSAIKKSSLDLPGGRLKTKNEEIVIRTKGQKYTGDEYKDIIVAAKPDGSTLKLYEIASIRDGFTEDPRSARFNGKPTAMVEVFKTPEQDIIKISDKVKEYILQKRAKLPAGLYIDTWQDNTKFVRGRLELLITNGLLGLVLVFLSLWVFLDIRLSFWVSMGIPVSFAGALWIMHATGQSMNMISMFGLLMVIGMVVDDAIVIGENVYTHILDGNKPWDAAISGTSEVAVPVVASTFTTVAAFYPLFVIPGTMGKFIMVIPLAVISCLFTSLVEAIVILPVHLRHTKIVPYSPDQPWHKRFAKKTREAVNKFNEFVIHKIYGPIFDISLKYRVIVISVSIAVLIVTIGFFRGGYIEFVFFPKSEEEIFSAKLAYPFGTPIEVTRKAIKQIEDGVAKTRAYFIKEKGVDVIESVTAILGEWGGYDGEVGTHAGKVTLKLTPTETRDIGGEEIKGKWREEVGEIPGVESLSFEPPRHGPGGKPIDIMFLSRDNEVLTKVTEEMKVKLSEFPGLSDIQSSFRPGKREIKIKLKPAASNFGLTLSDVANQLRFGFYGAEALRIQRGTDEVKVMVRYPLEERRSIKDLNAIHIRTAAGDELPFREVVEWKIEPGFSKITRENGLRAIHVTADIDESKNNARRTIQTLKSQYMKKLLLKYPSVSYKFEGQAKESRKTMGGLFRGFILSLLIIYSIIAVIFKSYFQPLVIMCSIPFGIVGAIAGHSILGKDLSMMSFFGIVALSGIVVNDSLVLVDFINNSLRKGKSVTESVADAGRARFRAVMLTSVTTVVGLLPLLLEKSAQAQFLIPMAISLSFGLMYSTLITLFIVPSLYLILNDIKRFAQWLIKGDYPSRELVEPSSFRDFEQ